jgi:hypothetical protein
VHLKATAARGAHHLSGATGAQHRPEQVDVEDAADHLDGRVGQIADVCGEAGVVDQPGHRSEVGRRNEEDIDGVRLADVTGTATARPPASRTAPTTPSAAALSRR